MEPNYIRELDTRNFRVMTDDSFWDKNVTNKVIDKQKEQLHCRCRPYSGRYSTSDQTGKWHTCCLGPAYQWGMENPNHSINAQFNKDELSCLLTDCPSCIYSDDSQVLFLFLDFCKYTSTFRQVFTTCTKSCCPK